MRPDKALFQVVFLAYPVRIYLFAQHLLPQVGNQGFVQLANRRSPMFLLYGQHRRYETFAVERGKGFLHDIALRLNHCHPTAHGLFPAE